MNHFPLPAEYMDSGPQRLSATGSDSSDNDKQSVGGRSYASYPRGSLSQRRQLGGGIKRSPGEGGEPKVSLVDVRPMWLEVPDDRKRYLLIEDLDTGDVLMPLVYMKSVFEANYTRKLSAMNHRIVEVPPNSMLAHNRKATDHLCWIWAFESPKQVKLVVRKELREDSLPQGHLRLVLLPIVYNAMSQKDQLRQMPLFIKLRAVLRASTYWPLLYHTSDSRQKSPAEGEEEFRLFDGPKDYRQTQLKYMMNISDAQESEGGGKRSRQQYQYSTDAGVHGGYGTGGSLEAQLAELRDDFKRYKRETEDRLAALNSEVHKCGGFAYQLYQYLLSGGPQGPPGMLQAQHLAPSGLATPSQPPMVRGGSVLPRGSSRLDITEEPYAPPTIESIPVGPGSQEGGPTSTNLTTPSLPVATGHDGFPPPTPLAIHAFPQFPGAGGMVPMPAHMLPNVAPSQPHIISGSLHGPNMSQLLSLGQQLTNYAPVGPCQYYPGPTFATPPGPNRGPL